MRKLLALWLALALLLPLAGCGGELFPASTEQPDRLTAPADGQTLTVSFLDVGQGDSVFIELPDSRTMLIDASESNYAGQIESYIRGRGHSKIDYLVATHPHSDHIGGMSAIVNAFDIGEVWMPDADSTTATYEKLLTAISDKGLKIHTAKAGKVILEEESLRISLLAPCSDSYSDLNNYSAVIKLTYGAARFLFTGDAEKLSEEEMLASGADLSADVLKIGHHGSSTSSSEAFLKAVAPSFGVISCGKDNSYGHPHQETLTAAEQLQIPLLRTDLEGTIVFSSDGSEIKRTEIGSEISTDYLWVLNTSSKKIHRPDCPSAATINDKNKGYSKDTVASLQAQGYTPCGSCKPAD